MSISSSETDWTMFCKRTEDPKLAWIEAQLDAREIPHRRNGHSFHGPILEVPTAQLAAADALLRERSGLRRWKTIDDVPDDHRMFAGYAYTGDPKTEGHFDPIQDGWIGKDGRP